MKDAEKLSEKEERDVRGRHERERCKEGRDSKHREKMGINIMNMSMHIWIWAG